MSVNEGHPDSQSKCHGGCERYLDTDKLVRGDDELLRCTECIEAIGSDRIGECLADAREALKRVGPPSLPDEDRDRLYYPLLFLCEAVEAERRTLTAGQASGDPK